MALIVSPPIKTTFQPESEYYVIKNRAVPMTMRIHKHTTVVAFRKYIDAEIVTEAMESQYMMNKEWPDLTVENFTLQYMPLGNPPTLLDIEPDHIEMLKRTCIDWNLNLCIIDEIVKKKSSIYLQGDILSFTAPVEYYQMLYESLLDF
jgi:hypothetical protein